MDAIVNAANSGLAGGGGVDGAIHRRAGAELAEAAVALAPCSAGEAVITPGFGLPSRYVIHAVGPIWSGGTRDEEAVLAHAPECVFYLAGADPFDVYRALRVLSPAPYMYLLEMPAAEGLHA